METIRIKARCVKCCFKKDDYRILSWSPVDKNDKIKLSLYFTFSTKGNDSYIDENKDYEIEIEEISYDKKYGGTYRIISVPSLNNFDVSALSLEEKKEILMDCTTSERIADNILEAYPNFIELILAQGKEAIDVKKIRGVGDAYLSSYSRNLLEKYKYLGIINHFKNLFSSSNNSFPRGFNGLLLEIITEADNLMLCSMPDDMEIWQAVRSIGPTKAPGPNGFIANFYQHYWQIVHSDVVSMIRSFFRKWVFALPTESFEYSARPKKRPSYVY